MQPVKSISRFLPTLIVLGTVIYIFTDPQGAAVAFKWAFQTVVDGGQQFAEFIRAMTK
jgi:hypothetical protein